jgi:hypothetical protein
VVNGPSHFVLWDPFAMRVINKHEELECSGNGDAAAAGPAAAAPPPPPPAAGTQQRRGAEIRAALDTVPDCPQAVALLGEAADEDLEELCTVIAGYSGLMVPVSTAGSPWSVWAHVPGICANLQTRLDRAGKTLSELLEERRAIPAGIGRIMAIVSALPRIAATGSSGTAAAGESGDALTRAAESLASQPEAKAGVQRLVRLGESGGDDAALRAAARALETSGTFGADIALILHQENLEKAPTGASPAASTLLAQMRQIRRYLLAARARWLEPYVPSGRSAEALVKAAMSGELKVETLTGAKAGGKAEASIRALMVIWPTLIALVRETSPRDATAESALLIMAKEAFDDAATNPAGALRMVIVDVFAELRKRSAQYLTGVDPEMASWDVVRRHVAGESQRKWLLSGTYGGKANAEQKTPEQLAAAAKAKADRERADREKRDAAAAAAASGETGGGGSGSSDGAAQPAGGAASAAAKKKGP